MNPEPQGGFPSFDPQAPTYERRAGLPPDVAAAVARRVAAGPGELIVEVGAGTGQIGELLTGAGAHYIGLDLSLGMLAVFRARLGAASPGPSLLQADCDLTWPIASGSARTIFSSRAIHLLDPEHAASEALRVAHPEGASLLIGSVRRASGGLHQTMRRELHRRLAMHGFAASDPEVRRSRLLSACCERGGELIQPQIVSRWSVSRSPRRMLDAWAGKPGLAGGDPPATVRERVLGELAEWAERAWGDPDRPFAEHEEYTLEGARLPPLGDRSAARGLGSTERKEDDER